MKIFLDRSAMVAMESMKEVMGATSSFGDVLFWVQADIKKIAGAQDKKGRGGRYDEHRFFVIDAVVKYSEEIFGEGELCGKCHVARKGDRWDPCSVELSDAATGRRWFAVYHSRPVIRKTRLEIRSSNGGRMFVSTKMFA